MYCWKINRDTTLSRATGGVSFFYFVDAQNRMTQLQAVSVGSAVLLQGSQTENALPTERPQCKEAADDVC